MNATTKQKQLIAVAIVVILLIIVAATMVGIAIGRDSDGTNTNASSNNQEKAANPSQSAASTDKEQTIIATVTGSPNVAGTPAADDNEYVLKADDGKIHHISILKGENPLPADATETCVSLNGLKVGDTVEFMLPFSPVHDNRANDMYYSTCHEGKAAENTQYFIKYAER